MIGKTNGTKQPGGGGLSSGDLVCWYWGRKNITGSATATHNITASRSKDYVSYDSDTERFTVLKAFTGTVAVIGTGTRNGTAGSAGAYALTINFRVNGSSVASGTITYTGNGTPAVFTHSFEVGDYFDVVGSQGITQYFTDLGYIVTIA